MCILGLLTHYEHLRTDPKHQFTAQIMLSRAFSSREQIAAAVGGSSLLSIGQNSRDATSPINSDTSSCNGRLSSSPLPDNNDNNNGSGLNDDASDNNNNTNGATNNSSIQNYNGKQQLSINDSLLNLRNQTGGHLHQQYQAITAAANAINHAAQNQSCNGSPGHHSTSAAQAVVNLAVAMRQNQPMANGNFGNQQSSPSHYHQNNHGHQLPGHHHSDPSDAHLRIQDVLRSQAEAAIRLAVSQAVSQASGNNGGNDVSPNQYRHHSNGVTSYSNHNNHHHQSGQQFSPDLLRMQEQRLEQALRIQNQNHP